MQSQTARWLTSPFGVAAPLALVAFTGAIVFATLSIQAAEQDDLYLRDVQALVASELADARDALARATESYAWWDDSVEHAARPVPDAAWIDEAITAYVSVDNAVTGIAVLGPDGAIVYPADAAPPSPDLTRLADSVRLGNVKNPNRASALVAFDGRLQLAGAMEITPDDAEAIAPPTGYVLVFFSDLEAATFAGILAEMPPSVAHMWFSADTQPTATNLVLTTEDGRTVGSLNWNATLPGSDFLRRALLPLAVALALFALVCLHLWRASYRAGTALRDAHEAAVAQRNEALELSRRADEANRSKSTFLATMSHELRTPLNAILGFSEMLTGEPYGPIGHERYLEYAGDIHKSGTHLLGVISDILDFSKAEAGKLEIAPERVDVAEAIHDCLQLVRRNADTGGIALAVHVSPPGAAIEVDPRHLRQVLINLLSNAVKFTPEGGRIAVTAAIVRGDYVFTVADTGIGISAEALPRLGELFYQVDGGSNRMHEGTGLGLALTRKLMQLHGGSLRFESTVGQGTRAIATFPASRILAADRRDTDEQRRVA